MAIQKINTDITPSLNQQPSMMYCSQGDIGRQIQVVLKDGSSDYTIPAGATLEIIGKKKDKNIFQYNDNITVSGSTATITLKDQMTACSGPVVCELRVRNNDDIIGAANFILMVEGGILDGSLSESALDIIAQIEAALEDVDDAVDEAERYAQAASGDADDAQRYAQAASDDADDAQRYAQAADQSADDAANNAIGVEHEVTFLSTSINSSTHLVNIAVTGVTATSQQEILPLPATSAANIAYNEDALKAQFYDGGQSTNQITLYVKNIPLATTTYKIKVIVRGGEV